MGTGYIRNDSVNNIADGNVINASDLDGEFDALAAAFVASTGHSHDGTANNGAPITKTGPNQEVVTSTTSLYPSVNNVIDLGTASNQYKNVYIDGIAYLDGIDFNGVAITATGTEINYLGGVTSAIQTQINARITASSSDTLTNKTINLTSNTLTGTLAQFNAALSDADFVSIAGTETLTNKTLTSPTINTATIAGGTINNASVGATTPNTGAFTSLSASGAASFNGGVTLGDASGDALTINSSAVSIPNGLTFSGGTTTFSNNQVISVTDNTNAALRITQLGTGNALLVEDSANPDSTPFVINNGGQVVRGVTSPITVASEIDGSQQTVGIENISVNNDAALALVNFANSATNSRPAFAVLARSNGSGTTQVAVESDDDLGTLSFQGSDGTNFIRAASIRASVDGAVGTNDMPGRLVFSTTADGASSPTERMRIDSAGNVGIGALSAAGRSVTVSKNITGSTTAIGVFSSGTTQSDVTSQSRGFATSLSTQATAFTLGKLSHYQANQGTFGLGSAVNTQIGFEVVSSLTGATNNYGFYSDIASGTGRYNFYANGTADNYFAGQVQLAAGSVGTPALGAFGDTNTGIFFPAADTIAFAEGGTEVMRITSAGNVGIGTSSPAGRLDVRGNSAASYVIDTTSGSAVSSALYLGVPSLTTYAGLVADYANDRLNIRHNSATRATFDASGNLGLGVTPSAWNSSYKAIELGSGSLVYPANATNIQLRMNAYTNSGGTEIYKATGIASLYSLGGGGNSHVWYTAPSGTAGNAITFTQAMTLDASGNLLVGTTSAQYSFSGRGSIEVNGSSEAILGMSRAGSASAYLYSNASDLRIVNVNNTPMQFWTNNTERMRIDSSGRVGIGTTSPAVRLEVSSTDAIRVPVGTTAQRPTGASGYIRFNSDTAGFEGFNGTAWAAVGGGNSTNTGIWENSATISSNYTVASGNNAMSAGPITIASGVTVTVPSGSSWAIV